MLYLFHTTYFYLTSLFRSSFIIQLIFLWVCLINSFSLFGQTTYYVAANGQDTNPGTTADAPLQNLAKVNQLSLQPGDAVLFRRGDTFRGTLLIRQSGTSSQAIVFDAYGSGPKPTLAGSVAVTIWSNMGGNIWQAACPDCGNTVTGVFQNETSLPLGRYPNSNTSNKGYLTIGSHTGQNQIVSQEHLPDNINWVGGEAVMRPTQWIIDRATIQQQSGDVLSLTNYLNSSGYQPSDGWGYFIQNHPATLDQNGEWYYDAANKIIKLFSDQINPNNQAITATTQSRGVDATGVSNIILRNLHITQTLNESVSATNVSSFTLSANDITNSGEDGISVKGRGSNVFVENNTLLGVNNNGVWFDAYQNVTFRGNRLRRIGVIPGRGKGGDGQYNGLQSTANDTVLIENNTIDSVGYNSVTVWSNTIVRKNIISNYCMTKSDGGGIYIWNGLKAPMTNIHIVSNIIYNGLGAPEGSFRHEYSGANGIFLDDCVENVEIKNNTVFHNIQWGVFLHAVSSITFTDNTLFDNGVSQLSVYPNGNFCLIRNNVITNNMLVSKLASQLVAQYESYTDDLFQYGTIDYNYYVRPYDDSATIRGFINASQGGQGGNYALPDWTGFSRGFDRHSKRSPLTYKQYRNDGAGGTNRFTSSFDTNLDDWHIVYSNNNNAEAALDNTNKLDGNSLRISFPTPSGQSNSYAQAIRRIGTLTKGKTYVLRFDAVASTTASISVYLRSYGPPYTEYDRRYTVAMSPTRTNHELFFTASADGIDPIIMIQIDGEGQTFWLDNIRLQEDAPIQNNPDEFIRLFYNPTLKDSLITLSGAYRDVKNQVYAKSFTLSPFTSIVLLKDTLPVSLADLSLSLQAAKRIVQVNESIAIRLRVTNQSNTQAALARWTYRLPTNLQFMDTNGQVYSDNVMTGTVYKLLPLADTTFMILVRPTAVGLFRTAAQITTATSPDPDSTPNSGTADGEDDVATVDFRVLGPATTVFESPNPNQRLLPAVASSQPTPVPNQADLSLHMDVSKRVLALGETITFTVYVNNAGGHTADIVHLENQLPDGFELVNAAGWAANGRLLSITLRYIAANTTVSLPIQARLTSPGHWINRAQISETTIDDPDSIPGNGYTNGEDDQTQLDLRSR